ncbi:ankyrin repeat domain-containing protein [Brachyspira sp.]|uniref:ankyrin repeat domain-containing protein n=1 Tax=Brachyspira sp. TaxID=1977261 RepID=UPI003D7D9EC3
MIKNIFILFIAIFNFQLFSEEKIKVAVLPFSSANEEEGDTLASMFANELSKRKVYRVLTRNSQMEKVMKELNFQRNGLTDENTRIEIGRALNAQYVLAGEVRKLGRNNVLIVSMINVETFENKTGDNKSFRNIEDVIQFVPQIVNEITGTRGRTVVDIDIFGDESEKTVVTSGDKAALERVINKRKGEKYIKDIETAVLVDINRYINYKGSYVPQYKQGSYMANEVTPLMIASAFKYNDLLKALVSVGADLDLKSAKDDKKRIYNTALNYSILSENVEGVSILLNAGASIDNRSDYLHDAIEVNNLNIVKLLVSKGIDVNQIAKEENGTYYYEGRSPLSLAVFKENADIVKFLLLHDANVNMDEEPILYTAVNWYDNYKKSSINIIKLLLDAGADIDIRYSGNTPLITAIKKGYADVVKLLIEYGADVNYADKKGKKPLYYAINISKKNEIIKLLVDEGATE